ncbi:hypothetical protein LDD39_08500 [Lactobacillus delbrueckii subsp. delbrueckii]|nr:hypothetical protein LDD39_08500 [Lactobacillus delbrueckii subsp. delbrueckii]
MLFIPKKLLIEKRSKIKKIFFLLDRALNNVLRGRVKFPTGGKVRDPRYAVESQVRVPIVKV